MKGAFKFEDGSPHNGRSVLYDNFRGGAHGGWTRNEFVYCVNAHQRAFGPHRTQQVFAKLFGNADPTQIPSYAYGVVIAALADEMSQGLPHNITRSPLYDVGK